MEIIEAGVEQRLESMDAKIVKDTSIIDAKVNRNVWNNDLVPIVSDWQY